MKKDLYIENSKRIVSETTISESTIFDIEKSNIKNIFYDYFNFCTNDLRINSEKFGLENSYFFFWDKEELNSGGTYNCGCYIIYVSKEQIIKLNEKLNEKKFFNNVKLNKYLELSKNGFIDLEYLLFQCSIIFTYYHEFSHLIHKKEKNFFIKTQNIEDDDYVSESHIYEYDADLNGCQFVCMKIIDNCETYSINNQKDIIKLLAIGLSGIVITNLLFYKKEFIQNDEIEEFYFKDITSTHPHHIVRISYIIDHYHQIANSNGIKFEVLELLKDTFEICAIYFENEKMFKDYLDLYIEKIKIINNYVDRMYSEAMNMDNLIIQHHKKYDL